jgi:4-hydroxy-tetrahydrodipicolinate reductase
VTEAAASPTVGVIGSTGRLGRAVLDFLAPDYEIVMTANRAGWAMSEPPGLVIDASHPSVLPQTADFCARHSAALIHCASTSDPAALTRMRTLGRSVAVVQATNLSYSHWLQKQCVSKLSGLSTRVNSLAVPSVSERHPPHKSATASASSLELADSWDQRPGRALPEIAVRREGAPVSDHEFTLRLPGETLTMSHRVQDLQATHIGLAAAAEWTRTHSIGFSSLDTIFSTSPLEEPNDE